MGSQTQKNTGVAQSVGAVNQALNLRNQALTGYNDGRGGAPRIEDIIAQVGRNLATGTASAVGIPGPAAGNAINPSGVAVNTPLRGNGGFMPNAPINHQVGGVARVRDMVDWALNNSPGNNPIGRPPNISDIVGQVGVNLGNLPPSPGPYPGGSTAVPPPPNPISQQVGGVGQILGMRDAALSGTGYGGQGASPSIADIIRQIRALQMQRGA